MKQGQKKQFGIIWLNKSSFYLYTETITQPIQHIFAENIVNYLEIIDEVQFETDMAFFFQQCKLLPTNFVLILAQDTLFEKEFSSVDPTQITNTEQQFFDSIPFENVYSKVWKNETSIHLAAFNSDFYLSMKKALEKAGSDIIAAVPFFAVGKDQLDQETIESTNSLIKKHEALKQANFVENQPVEGDNSSSDDNHPKKGVHSKRELILIGLFVFLLLILFGVVYWQFFIQSSP